MTAPDAPGAPITPTRGGTDSPTTQRATQPHWRLHPEPGGKRYLKGPHWRVCDNPDCPLEHVDYTPFRPMVG